MWRHRQHPSNTRAHCTFVARGLVQRDIHKPKQYPSSLAAHHTTPHHDPRGAMQWKYYERSKHHAHTPPRQQQHRQQKTTLKINVKGPPEHAPRRSATRTPCELCWKRSMVLNFRAFERVWPHLISVCIVVYFAALQHVCPCSDRYLINRTRAAAHCGR